MLYRPDILGHGFPNKQEVIYFKHLLKLTTILGRTNSWDILTSWDGQTYWDGQIFWDGRYGTLRKKLSIEVGAPPKNDLLGILVRL